MRPGYRPGVPITDPGLVIAWWYPAMVKTPGEPVFRRTRVYVTTSHVLVYRRVPQGSEEPDWSAAIDLERTARPKAGVPAAGGGIDLVTDAGLVVVTPEGGCGCSSPLKHWKPTWADDTTPWPGG